MPAEEDPLEQVSAYAAGYGVGARPLREIIAALTRGPCTLEGLVAHSTLSRRGVEGLLAAAGSDLERGPRGIRIRADRVGAYRERFGSTQLEQSRLPDPLTQRLRDNPGLLADMERFTAAAPLPVRSLDHVTATPETAARRALWLAAEFDLAGARLLCVGDHDLSALAACSLIPELAVTVVDIDERVLAFIDEQARQRGWDIRCMYADLRHGLPAPVHGWADLILTDPPYTPEGAALFLARGLEGMRAREHGRLVMAYGYGEGTPSLGLKVQRRVQRLHLTFEAIVPAFNRYRGAQAIGSASDLYVCRPTPRTWQALDKLVDGAVANVYTRGPHAREATSRPLDTATADLLRAHAAGSDGLPVSMVVGEAWPHTSASRVTLARLLDRGVPQRGAAGGAVAVAADLSDDPGPWLLRLLLAVNADRVAALVPNAHPDLGSEASQRELAGLLRGKYSLRFHRSTPASQLAVVVAERLDGDRVPIAERTAQRLLERAHGTVASVWRERLIAASRDIAAGRNAAGDATPLTKNDARQRVRRASRHRPALDARVIDLPRHQLGELLEDVTGSARGLLTADRASW